MRKYFLALVFMLCSSPVWAQCTTLPFTLLPGTTADGGQVMADLNALNLNCANSVTVSGGCPNITAFGGVGDGTTDNTTAFFLTVQQNPVHACVQFPAGVFAFNSPLAVTVGAGQGGIAILGNGPGVTSLVWPNGGGGLSLQMGSENQSARLVGFDVLTKQNGGGTGITITNTNCTAGCSLEPTSVIDHVTVRGFDGPSKLNYWNTAILINSASNVSFVNVFLSGSSGLAGNGISLQATPTNLGMDYNLISVNAECLDNGLLIGNQIQGVTISAGSNFVCGNIGALVEPGGSGLDQLTIIGSSFNETVAGVRIASPINAVFMESNTFIPGNNVTASAIGIDIQANTLASITHNNFQAGTTGTIGINANNGSGLIEGNQCIFLDTCIKLTASSIGWHVTNDNVFGSGVGTTISDAGPNNVVDATTPWTPTLVGATTPGSPTYGQHTGIVYRSGSYVNIVFTLTGTSLGGATGFIEVHGLPSNFSGQFGVCTVTGGGPQIGAGVGSSQFIQLSGIIDPSANVIRLFVGADATSSVFTPLSDTVLAATFNLYGTCSYLKG